MTSLFIWNLVFSYGYLNKHFSVATIWLIKIYLANREVKFLGNCQSQKLGSLFHDFYLWEFYLCTTYSFEYFSDFFCQQISRNLILKPNTYKEPRQLFPTFDLFTFNGFIRAINFKLRMREKYYGVKLDEVVFNLNLQKKNHRQCLEKNV